jgi:hypothetical protein
MVPALQGVVVGMTRPRGTFEERTVSSSGSEPAAPEMRERLVLIRGALQRARMWPECFAADTCDALCAVVDEALTLEDALRGVLATICGRMRWNAGRAAHRDVQPVWFVDTCATIGMLRHGGCQKDATVREIPWNEPWSASRSSELLRIVFPIDWSADAWLEFYSSEFSQPYANALDDVARALVPAAMILPRKSSERTQRCVPPPGESR